MIKKFLLNLFIKHYLRVDNPSDFVVITKKGDFLVSGKKITETQSQIYREAAEVLNENSWLKVIISTLRSHAEKQIMYKGTDFETVKNNRMVLYVVGEIERLIKLPVFYDKAKENYTSQEFKNDV